MNTRVLVYWWPDLDLSDWSDHNRERLRVAFRLYVHSLGYRVGVHSVQSPIQLAEWLSKEADPYSWHHDCNGKDASFLLWSNLQPTDIRFLDGALLKVGDGALIEVDNTEVEHRTPPPLNPERWLVRSHYWY